MPHLTTASGLEDGNRHVSRGVQHKRRPSTREASEVAEAVVRYLKCADAKHVASYGPGELSASMAARKLVSEYRFRRESRMIKLPNLRADSESVSFSLLLIVYGVHIDKHVQFRRP